MVGIFALPAGPGLVCRITGESIVPVLASIAGNEQHSCCVVDTRLSPDGVIRYYLSAPGCCELHHNPERAEFLADKHILYRYTRGAVSAPATVPLAVPMGAIVEVALSYEVAQEASPRGPPLLTVSPRAPPFFS